MSTGIKHKYLEDIGVRVSCYIDSRIPDEDKDRESDMIKERNLYGFDQREVWNLHTTAVAWLYEHLKRYIESVDERGVVDINYHKFDIPVYEEWTADGRYAGITKETAKDKTQRECIEICINYLEEFLKIENFDPIAPMDIQDALKRERDAMKKAQCAFEIFSMIMPVMWW